MVVKARDIINTMQKIAPPHLAEDWDNSGWQVGDPRAHVKKILLALDVTPEVVDEAEKNGAQLIISHHPLMLKGIKSLRKDNPQGNLLFRLIRAGIGVYAAHTNLDSAKGGVNDVLAEVLGLQGVEVLHPVQHGRLLKLVVFVPAEHAGTVRKALGDAGAGWIGNYSDCTFNLQGTGKFRPLEGTNPFIGAHGKLQQVEEVRIETIIKKEDTARVLAAMLEAHPYEEVAYDLYPLENRGMPQGLGRIGILNDEITLYNLAQKTKELLQVDNLRFGGRPESTLKKVAVCGGSGGDLWPVARQQGAEVLITGDVRYHAARDMLAAGISFIDAGHFATECLVLPVLKEKLAISLDSIGVVVELSIAQCEKEPWISI